ncbi:MAG TPA: hypothetical protein DC049_11285, partial [Spirochaetia bacterium]|nr:hypothetical protein [Spirochaetia bacterium]
MEFKEYLLDHKKDLFRSQTFTYDPFKMLRDEARAESDQQGVVIIADSMEEAFIKAASELNVDISRLEYKILEKGSSGVFGLGKSRFKIHFSVYTSHDVIDEGSEVFEFGESSGELQLNMDGKAAVDINREGIFIIIYPPRGEGHPVSAEAAMHTVREKEITDFPEEIVKLAVSRRDGKPYKIGDWKPNAAQDGKVFLEISDDQMKGYIRII